MTFDFTVPITWADIISVMEINGYYYQLEYYPETNSFGCYFGDKGNIKIYKVMYYK